MPASGSRNSKIIVQKEQVYCTMWCVIWNHVIPFLLPAPRTYPPLNSRKPPASSALILALAPITGRWHKLPRRATLN